MFADDRPGYPMTFVIEIRLSGDFRFEEFSSACSSALARHPLLCSHVSRIRGKLYWTKSHRPHDIERDLDIDSLPASWQEIDLTTETGVKLRVSEDDQETLVTFVFHHAATDGIGAIRFIGDVLGIYGIQTAENDEVPELHSLSNEALLARGQLWDQASVPDRSWKRTLRHMLEFSTCFPASIAKPKTASENSLREHFFVSRQLNRKLHSRLKNRAHQLGVHPNGIYLSCYFFTMKAWNQAQGRKAERESYRVLIPTSLRTSQHDQLSAANVLSMILIHLTGSKIENSTHFILNLHRRMSQILNTADSRFLVRVLQIASRLPGGMFVLTRNPIRYCTGVLANVGDVKRQFNCRFPLRKGKCVAGSVVLESLYGAAPIRKGTAIGVSLGTYAGELLVNFNCDSKVLPNEQAESFADLYMSKLSEFTDEMKEDDVLSK